MKALYEEVLGHPEVGGIVIGTRPDCVDEKKLDYLAGLASGRVLSGWQRSLRRAPGPTVQAPVPDTLTAPIVVVEYGIESCHDSTLRHINRGHSFECARKAVEMTAERGIDTGAHFILGLPGETRETMLESCALINALPLHSVKFHQLQLVKGTAMAREYSLHPEDFVQHLKQEDIQPGIVHHLHLSDRMQQVQHFAFQQPSVHTQARLLIRRHLFLDQWKQSTIRH